MHPGGDGGPLTARRTVPAGVVVLSYEGRDATLECLSSLAAADPAPARVVVVDNASSDGSQDALETWCRGHRDTELLLLRENQGYAGGMNRGIERLLAGDVRWLLLLNNDTQVDPAFLEPLAARMDGPSAPGIATPRILHADGRTIWSAGERVFYPLLLARRAGGRPDGPAFDLPRPVNAVTGCAMAVRREVFETVGLLDEDYFAYYEEIDFCRRALDAGFACAYVPGSVVRHRGAAVLGERSPRQVHLKARNRMLFVRKRLPPPWWPVTWAWNLLVATTWAAGGLLRGRGAVAAAAWRGTVEGLRGRGGPPDWARR